MEGKVTKDEINSATKLQRSYDWLVNKVN